MESRMDLLKKYINKEAEDFECPPEETTSYMRVKTFFEYRNIRIKQAWYSKINQGKVSREIAQERSDLDRRRRECHNLALTSVLGFDRVATVLNLPPLYTGNKLTPDEIERHDSSSLDVRKEMTDWFFGLMNDIYDYRLEREDKDKRNEEKFIESLKDDVYKFDSQYGVEEPIREDDGDVIFDIDRDGI